MELRKYAEGEFKRENVLVLSVLIAFKHRPWRGLELSFVTDFFVFFKMDHPSQ